MPHPHCCCHPYIICIVEQLGGSSADALHGDYSADKYLQWIEGGLWSFCPPKPKGHQWHRGCMVLLFGLMHNLQCAMLFAFVHANVIVRIISNEASHLQGTVSNRQVTTKSSASEPQVTDKSLMSQSQVTKGLIMCIIMGINLFLSNISFLFLVS